MSTTARKLFGTDGIRGIAGEAPLDAKTIFATGLALGHSVSSIAAERRVILGRDTRESSPWIAATLAAGLREAGVAVESAGVITTPAVAFLARTHGYAAGVVISASHNPWRDNGIKLFGANGYKLPDSVELMMEDEILRHANLATAPDPATLPTIADNENLQQDYIEFLIQCVPGLNLDGLKIVADCANGAAAAVAPELFHRLGGEVTLLNISPDGRNINAGCGALHPEWVAAEVQKRGADVGVTFDGDADRCMLAGPRGNVINGDAILLMAARDLKARGMLTGDVAVATTMSNMGLEAALKRSGIGMMRAPVGDRYVLEMMQQHDAALGGEQSGHILFPHLATTGDGLLTALVVLDLVARSGKSVDELTADLKVFPQVIVNVKVREKKPLESIPVVAARIKAAEQELKDSGRVVIRYSGTEALARVMIEAEDEGAMRRHADAIADAIREELGI
ncbi:phosphoglucosamine mutase [Occallatibacter riparius]|uniref:Phosphoglucosamine mutase n=1 Tax=Occallatibacter riparius TaxID=1002689 RepID=A0A9J7BKB1_9BACT|nr:phosphoglucosamine mutase [Occallatibacter riparius]UWZ83308.1 phosphoglucosamine mutase [Occallatibacter riparius]